MAVKELKTIIQLHRDTEANWASIEQAYLPRKGEVCLIDTTTGLRAKVGDGTTYLKSLPYTDKAIYEEIDKVVITGYYLNEKFYIDSTYTVELDKNINRIYIDKNSNVVYHYDGGKYVSINDTLPTASDTVAGIMKLYQSGGTNTDGAMSQKGITQGVQSIGLAVNPDDDDCLIIDLPWDNVAGD